ncbi:MAG: ABC transporter permease, partial [Peptostreptococcaceae bacterium]|nr:ABC transporter permease [Peptostreptococcaceae bacterium]
MDKVKDLETKLQELEETQKRENPIGFSVIVREFKKDKLARIFFYLLMIFIAFIFIFSATVNMDELNTVDIFRKYEAPSFNNIWDIFGRDSGGRSVFGMLVVGTRNSILVGISITLITSF